MTIPYSTIERNGDLNEYITPPQLIRACVSLVKDYHTADSPLVVLDPGCNLGQWGDVLKTVYPDACLTGVELLDVPPNPNYVVWTPNTDFLTWNSPVLFNVIIGNPPYSIYTPDKTGKNRRKTVVNTWVKHSLDLLTPGGTLIYVLREGFNHNVYAWKHILTANPPVKEYLLLPRPNFFGKHDPRTDGSSGARYNYSVFVWQKGYEGQTIEVPLYWKDIPHETLEEKKDTAPTEVPLPCAAEG